MATQKTARRRSFGTLRTMRNGRVQASYIYDGDGKRYYALHTYDNRTDAEGWLANERKLIELGEWTPPKSRAELKALTGVTLREYADLWMDADWRRRRWADSGRELTPKTHALYTRLLNTRILPDLGDEILRAVTPARVRAWWVDLSKRMKTPTSNTQAYQLLKAIYATAVEDKAATENPCQIKSAGKPPKARDVKPLTPAELDTVAQSAPEAYRVAVPVAAWCGLRFGELVELRRKDVHDDGERVTLKIRRAATRVDNKLVVGPPKTDAGIRDVTVPPHVAEQLREHMQKHTGRGPESFVFTTTRGRRLSTTAFTKSVKAGFASVGKGDMRVHDLRHVGATLAAQAGATTKELMSRLGHTTPGMAMRYQIAAQERDAKIAEAMSKLAAVTTA
ncbi:tyrosine-type recombinase/integrase [Mycolicibacterium sp. ELW1]|uniref:tyrosine-type recombinase/integrase n=1 Tax=Mycobacteriaceae TaxID=1762 RepID=UPI0011EFC721|nr:site-specific integrase [Mycobacterium sp. ELW1]QEN13460.1 site-specific integrase [Mycobacterium sp. ELW1]